MSIARNARNSRCPASRTLEPLRDSAGTIVGVLDRRQHSICGIIELEHSIVGDGVFTAAVQIENVTPITDLDREACQLRALVSTHTILNILDGEFVSLTDPPEDLRHAAAACRNVGCWPVLVGNDGDADAVLSSPIILPDYPQIAPESPGDLFDGTEIDEILNFPHSNVDRRREAVGAGLDSRTRRCWNEPSASRTSTLGFARNRSRLAADCRGDGPWLIGRPKPITAASNASTSASLKFAAGDRVLLRPNRRADILDLALVGKAATVEAIEQDFEGRVYLAVTVDDDPGRDLGDLRQPGHRFFFQPDEIEPLEGNRR